MQPQPPKFVKPKFLDVFSLANIYANRGLLQNLLDDSRAIIAFDNVVSFSPEDYYSLAKSQTAATVEEAIAEDAIAGLNLLIDSGVNLKFVTLQSVTKDRLLVQNGKQLDLYGQGQRNSGSIDYMCFNSYCAAMILGADLDTTSVSYREKIVNDEKAVYRKLLGGVFNQTRETRTSEGIADLIKEKKTKLHNSLKIDFKKGRVKTDSNNGKFLAEVLVDDRCKHFSGCHNPRLAGNTKFCKLHSQAGK